MFWILRFYYFHCCWVFLQRNYIHILGYSQHTCLHYIQGYSYISEQKLETGKAKEWDYIWLSASSIRSGRDCLLEIYIRPTGCHTLSLRTMKVYFHNNYNQQKARWEDWEWGCCKWWKLKVCSLIPRCLPSFPSLAVRLSTRLTKLKAMGSWARAWEWSFEVW